ncbi:hypothetical protein [Lactococcus lactis]
MAKKIKKYTTTEIRNLKSRAKELSEALNEDLDQVIASYHEKYIHEKQAEILEQFIKNKKREQAEREVSKKPKAIAGSSEEWTEEELEELNNSTTSK